MKTKSASDALLHALQDRFLLRFGVVANGYVSVPGRLKLLGYDLHPHHPNLGMTIDASLHMVFTSLNEPIYQVLVPGYAFITLDPRRLDIFPNEYNTPIALLKIVLQMTIASGFPYEKGMKIFVHSEFPAFGNFAYSTSLIIGLLSTFIPTFFTLPLSSKIAFVHAIEKRIPNYRFQPHDAIMILQPGFHHGYWVNGEPVTRQLPSSFLKNHLFYTLNLPKKTTVQPLEWMIPSLLHDFFIQEKITDHSMIDSLWIANHHQRLMDTYGKKTVDGLLALIDEQKRIIQSIIRYEQEDWLGFSNGLVEQEQQRIRLLVDSPSTLSVLEKRKNHLCALTPDGYWIRSSLNEEDTYVGWHSKEGYLKVKKMMHRHFPHIKVTFFRLYDKKLKIVKT